VTHHGSPDSPADGAHIDGCSLRCSRTRRTARSRTSGENLVTSLFMAPFSQELEPPQNSGRFNVRLSLIVVRVPCLDLIFGLRKNRKRTYTELRPSFCIA
jgi:hypothetical protein